MQPPLMRPTSAAPKLTTLQRFHCTNTLHKTGFTLPSIFRPPFLKGEVMATPVGTQGVVRIDASPDNWMCVPLDFFTSDEPASCSLA